MGHNISKASQKGLWVVYTHIHTNIMMCIYKIGLIFLVNLLKFAVLYHVAFSKLIQVLCLYKEDIKWFIGGRILD